MRLPTIQPAGDRCPRCHVSRAATSVVSKNFVGMPRRASSVEDANILRVAAIQSPNRQLLAHPKPRLVNWFD